MTLKEKIDWNVQDIRGVIGKIERGAPSYEVTSYLEAIANSLENVHKNMQDTPVRG